jgi:transglutaminase-like putative cysteine protease
MITFLPRLGWQKSEHGYTIVSQKAVPADTSWSISLPWFVSDIHERTPNPWSEAVQVYSDPQLTVPLTHVSTSDTFTILGHKVHFSPKASILEANPNYQGKDRSIGITGLWPAGTYYVAQLQGFWGTTLKTPRVHIYTVEPHARSLSNPNFTMRVSEDGVPLFEWEPVEDATEYFILTTMPRPLGDQTTSQMTLIGVVDGEATKWLASSNDMGYHNQRQNSQPASSYNSVFTAYTSDYGVCAPQDDSYQGLEPPAWDDSMLQYPQFTVLAVSEDQETSFAQFHDGRDLIRKTPTKTAINTLTEIQETSKNPILIPEEFPVTMGDCSTSFYPTQARTLVSAPDRSTIALTYGVQGTLLTEMITTEGGASYTEISNLGSSLGLRTLYERGVAEDLTVLDDAQLKIYAQGLTVSTQAPEAPYTWNGSSEMVKYIAANLFAGQAAIDLSQFLDDPQAPLIYDAANEAYLQNPYITDMFPVVGVRGTILYVHYEMTYQERIESAARLKAKVDSIMAAIINPGMNDWQKASAINRYLATNAVYDNAAANWATGKSRTRDEFLENHPNAWDAEGVLLDGKGVCSSYSASFKLLADTAGLTAINITGYTDGDPSLGHAWNKVKLDGRWLIIDPTWNSNVWEQVRGNVETYFAMSDAQANRVEFDAFSIDTLIPSYATG